MSDRILLVLALVGALLGIGYLVVGDELFSTGGGGGAEEGGLEGGDLRGVDGEGRGEGDGTAEGRRQPTLFGRAREQRTGRGGLHGRVMDFTSGTAVVAAAVTLDGTGYGGEPVTVRTTTDAAGRFAFASVAAGDGYVLQVADGQGRARMLPSRSVDHGGLTDVGTIWLGRKGTLRGRVLDTGDKPIAGVDVQVHGGEGSMYEMLANFSKLFEQLDKDAEPLARAETDAQGGFEISDLAPGPVTLVARGRGYQVLTHGVVMAEDGAAGGSVTLRLMTGQPVHGIVVDDKDRPLAGARVACLQDQDVASVLFARQFTVTGADGRFTLDAVPVSGRGRTAVIVAADGYPTMFTQTQGDGEQRFQLTRGARVTIRIVEAAGGRPVEGAMLTAMFGGDDALGGGGMTFATATTDGGGEAHFVARPGKLQMLHFVHAEHGTTNFAPRMGRMMGGAAKQAMLRGPDEVTVGEKDVRFEFELGAGITVRGRVTDQDGNAVVGARVRAMGAMGFGEATQTDADGRYELTRQGPPVRFVLVTKPGYVLQTKGDAAMFTKMHTEDFERDVTLLRAGSVAGRVLLPDGNPAVGARVKAGTGDDQFGLGAIMGVRAETITNAEGRYVLDGVHPGGEAYVMVRHAGFLDAKSDNLTVAAAGATRAPDVVLARGASLTVRVERPDGRPSEGADVSLDLDTEAEVDWDPFGGIGSPDERQTKADGTATWPHLAAGEGTVTATAKGFAPGRATVTVPEAAATTQTVRVTIHLRPAVRLVGRVLDPDDRPIAGARLTLSQPEAVEDDAGWMPTRYATSDAEGRFAIDDVPGLRAMLATGAEGFGAQSMEVTPGLGDIVVRMTPEDPGVAAQLEALEAELMTLYQQIGEATDAESRQALFARIQVIQEQKEKLEKGDR